MEEISSGFGVEGCLGGDATRIELVRLWATVERPELRPESLISPPEMEEKLGGNEGADFAIGRLRGSAVAWSDEQRHDGGARAQTRP
ncbi:hypothetical protein Bca4012_009888 [Brassica carinata]|uniref:Uncharacterized protein n=1 Tax=Brassica carinata TaxID=52824 RepID=A0A8X7S713_BRACI|nr:hypothetical protein Bca52824_035116 [Brassica carinata]